MDDAPLTTFGTVKRSNPAARILIDRAAADPRGTATRLIRRSRREAFLSKAAERWVPGQPDPARFVPGDVCALRSMSSSFELRVMEQLMARGVDGSANEQMLLWLAQADVVFDAVPFFLPAGTAVGVMGADQPSEELLPYLRLPFERVLVFFDRDLPITDPITVPPQVEQGWEEAGDDVRYDIVRAAKARGPLLTGVVLHAGPDGVGLADDVVWLVAADTDPDAEPPWHLDRQRGLVLGSLATSTLRPIAVNLAAAVSWAEWREPEDPPDLPDPASKDFRKATRKGAFRRKEPHGVFAGVWVIDHTPDAPTGPSRRADTERSHASPVTHLRAGHPRRVRVGPRDDWRYEVRWIPPTVVNPGNDADDRVRVYRVPSTVPS